MYYRFRFSIDVVAQYFISFLGKCSWILNSKATFKSILSRVIANCKRLTNFDSFFFYLFKYNRKKKLIQYFIEIQTVTMFNLFRVLLS